MNSSAATSPLPGAAASSSANPAATRALYIGLLGIAIALIGMFIGFSHHDSRPVIGYLIGIAFWLSMSIGMLFLVMLFYMFDAGWAIIVRRQLEHAFAAIPMIALCFVPLLLMALGVFGQEAKGLMWQWLDPAQPLVGKPGETIGEDPLFLNKAGYLSLSFFLVRLALYLAVFWGVSRALRRNSFAMDTNPNAAYVLNSRKISAAGLFLVAFATTFAAFDLFMSLTYQWFSTMYGVWFFAASMRAGLAGTVIMCFFMSAKPGRPLFGIYNRAHQYLLGCLCLTFTIFWAYISFDQYFLIYNANIPEETSWFNLRELNASWTHSSWWWVSLAIIFCHFFAPFFALLSYHLKVWRRGLVFVCCWILCFHLLDLYFNILPGALPDPQNTVLHYKVREFVPQIWDFAALIGIGGLCVWAYLRSQPKAEPIPIHDPRILESLDYHE